MNQTWKAVGGMVLIYLFGCFSGAVSTSIFFHHRLLGFLQHPGLAILEAREQRLTGNLHLDGEQRRQIHELFLENMDERKEVQKTIQPRMQVLDEQITQQIAAVLRPDQAQIFRENVERMLKHNRGTGYGGTLGNPGVTLTPTVGGSTNSSSAVAPTR